MLSLTFISFYLQITEEHIGDLNSVLSVGMPIKCMIIDHDKVNGRIALSTKVLEPEPGDMLRNSNKVMNTRNIICICIV